MLKNLSRLEFMVEDKIGHFYLDSDTPIGHVKEMFFQGLKYVGALENQIKANIESEKAKEVQAIDQEIPVVIPEVENV
jgi:hypothetical protein